MGMAGWTGISVNNITVTAPVIILTIAVCDSVHLLVIYLKGLELNQPPLQAMRESLSVNLQPVILTSVTTAVGFLSLNFSDSPNFRDLGNISAFGVMCAMLLSLTILPALTILVVRKRSARRRQQMATVRIADFVIKYQVRVFYGSMIVALALIALIPLNEINDDPATYFKRGVPFRNAVIFAQENLPGIKNIDFLIDCKIPGCINDPEFLHKLEEFGDWMEQQDGVKYVSTYIDVIKRLNRNMYGDNPDYYRVPDDRELAAQYQLLYELSLPYGLDLNNQINFDKSATRFGAWVEQEMPTRELVDLELRSLQWLDQHYPELSARGASLYMMFAVNGGRNIRSMSLGAVFAMLGVTLTILIAIRSFKHGLLSMVPNVFPAAMAFGIWGVLIGQVNMIVAMVFSVTLGIVVDNTVHFISKYRRAKQKGDNTEQAIHYAFSTVGTALLITTAVLTIGFGLLTLSDFNLNAFMGGLTAITIVVALIFDFLMLPALLLLVDKSGNSVA